MPEPWIEKIAGFRTAEIEASKLQEKRLVQKQENGRPTN